MTWHNRLLAIGAVATITILSGPIENRRQGIAQEKQKSEATSIRFSEHLIANNYAYAYGIAAADFDKDGDLDLTSADYTPHNKLYLFENDGRGKFNRHVIQKDDPERLERHMIGDVDADGDLDVVIVKNLRGDLLWFENSGSPTDDRLWKRHVITTDLPGAYDVALADFNGTAGSTWLRPAGCSATSSRGMRTTELPRPANGKNI